MRILALDQSSRITGWALFDGNELIEYGKFDLSEEPNIGERLHQARCLVQDIINKLNVDKVILEDIYMDGQRVNNVQTFKILAEVFGVLYELCIDMNIPVEAVLAGTWKSTLGIKGKTRPEQKRAAQAWVAENYGLKVVQDIADAICIGSHYLKTNKPVLEWGE